MNTFFFGHALISPKTAGQIIKASQNQYLNDLRDSIEKFLNGNLKNGLTKSNIISYVRYIKNPDEFFRSMDTTQGEMELKGEGMMSLTHQIDIHASTFGGMTSARQKLFLELTAKYDHAEPTLEEYSYQTETLRTEERFAFSLDQKLCLTELEKFFGVEDTSTRVAGALIG
uniref:Uncharacterized protein n=1 Tax=Panagrolaimus davidi TaxID=227884 RepID=A0A914PD21_9BILA